jgi:uncharacterized membrane protein
MRRSRDFKRIALDALKGRWWKAAGVTALLFVIASTMASIIIGLFLGGTAIAGFGTAYTATMQGLGSIGGDQGTRSMALAFLNFFAIFALLELLAIALIAGLSAPLQLGYIRYWVGMLKHEGPSLDKLFSRFKIFFKAAGQTLYIALLSFLWGLPALVVYIGGFVLGASIESMQIIFLTVLLVIALSVFAEVMVFRYAMAPYLMAQYPGKGVFETIRESKALMKGNKWRLFCIQLGFFGWACLAILPMYLCMIPLTLASMADGTTAIAMLTLMTIPIFLIGLLVYMGAMCFLAPYMQATQTAFYFERTGQLPPQGAPEAIPSAPLLPAQEGPKE